MKDRERATSSIFVFIFTFIFAVFLSSFHFIHPLVALLLIVVGSAILIAEKIYKNNLEREIIFISIALIASGIGILRYDMKDFHIAATPSTTGIVVSEPEHRDNDTRFVFKADNGEKVLVSTDMYSAVEYGDRVELAGKLKEPGVIMGEDGREFDYGKYLSKDNIYYTASFAEVAILSHGNGNKLKWVLLSMKASFVRKAKEILPEPESSLLAGLIVSGKEAMPENNIEEFRRAGVVHIVVLSGYNITIIAEFMRVVFRSAAFSMLGILFFVVMTGASATVVRAALMVLAVQLSKVLRRNFSAPRALLAAAFLMLLENPKILVFDPSFQLSFLATAALIFVSPRFERHLKRVPEKWGIRGTLATTLATQIVVLPYLVYNMGSVSLVAIAVNLLILLIIPATMLTGFITVLLSYASHTIAVPFAYVSHLLLGYILAVAHLFASFPFASMQIPPIRAVFAGAIYVLISLYFARAKLSSALAQFKFWKKASMYWPLP